LTRTSQTESINYTVFIIEPWMNICHLRSK